MQPHAPPMEYLPDPLNLLYLATPGTYTTASPGIVAWPLPGFFFSFFAQRRPHALHSVLGPVGPFRHSGESSVPVSISHALVAKYSKPTYRNQYIRIRPLPLFSSFYLSPPCLPELQSQRLPGSKRDSCPQY
jgi:hypothetical protein